MTDDPVHAFLRDYAAAVFDRDLPRFLDLYADEVQVFDSWNRWEYAGREDWAGMIAAWFEGIQDVRVRVTAKDVKTWHDTQVAGGSATLEFAALDADGQPLRATENRLTVLLRNDGGTWRIVHQHTSVPVDFQSKQVVSR
ncbi:nuclear transport factor 2 family protein [Mitsuaria sp. CC2]|uniref:YybH family protein n=1 Tax=Mitsuaria sp. CC2 TaxID=3029186 RepID=UPI003B8AD29F